MNRKYAIIDIETTGGRASRDKITEIAVIITDGQRQLERFETLVNPETPIPAGITELTGITNAMVAEAPRFYEIARTVVELTEGAVFVAHNVRFDYGFLQEEFRRLGYTYVRRQLCTVRLARKVFPGFSSYSLGNLIRQMGLDAGARHRAMGDALATADLFHRMLSQEAGTRETETLVNLGVRESMLPKCLTLESLHRIPEACGVYYFHDEKGAVIYVGKSINIQKRVAAHFGDKTAKAARLQQAVADITWELTGSELVALLLESHEIKRLRPPVNAAQKARQFPFLVTTYTDAAGYIRLVVGKDSRKTPPAGELLNRFSKLTQAQGWLRQVAETHTLCARLCHLEERAGPCFGYGLKQCLGACIGEEPAETYNERAREAVATMDGRFPQSDFLLLDRGRSAEETAVVLVRDGSYRGFGYVNHDMVGNDLETVQAAVRAYEDNPEVRRIIRRFMDGAADCRFIPL